MNSVKTSKTMFAFRKNMVTLARSNAQNYENLRTSVSTSLFNDYYQMVERGSAYDKYATQGVHTQCDYLRNNDNSTSNPNFSNRYGELAQFIETQYPEDSTETPQFSGDIETVKNNLQRIVDQGTENSTAFSTAINALQSMQERGLTYVFAYNSNQLGGIQFEGYK